jgi:acyl carrier protein
MTTPMDRPPEDLAAGLATQIGQLIQDRLGVRANSVDDDLIASGVLDSLTLVQLLVDVEECFGITIPLEELEIDDIRSISRLSRLVTRRKLAYAAA